MKPKREPVRAFAVVGADPWCAAAHSDLFWWRDAAVARRNRLNEFHAGHRIVELVEKPCRKK